MRARLVTVTAFAAAVCLPLPARADNRTAAAEHFALAQSAENRGDWRAAIAEYERAYELQPHPAVLYNIAANHERLEDRRTAARYFLMYLDESPGAEDREQVLSRVTALRKAPSNVTFACRQPGASIVVDGQPRGTAPLTLSLPAGSHQAYAELNGSRTQLRTITVEYGDATTVTFDVTARPGLLQVLSNVTGAEVRLDGNVIGYTPFTGQVDAGDHKVTVTMSGYKPYERAVSVPAQGSEQIRANLARDGDAGESGDEPEGPEGRKWLIGTGYGFNTGTSGIRYEVSFGYRAPSNRFDASVLLGTFGPDLPGGVGGSLRIYLGTQRLRPYLRGGAIVGTKGEGTGFGLEAGAGLLWTGKRSAIINWGIEYFLEAGALWIPTDDDDGGEVNQPAGLAAATADAISFPIFVGILVRFGG